jgi:hypothetical protein
MSTRAKPLSDTPPSVAQVQIRLLREAGPARRAALAAAMTTNAVAVSRLAIRRLHPDWSELEVNLHWAEIHYGKELADRVRAYLAQQPKE